MRKEKYGIMDGIKRYKILWVIFTFIAGWTGLFTVSADQIYLTDNRTISGKITGGDEFNLYVDTGGLRVVSIKKDLIARVIRDEEMGYSPVTVKRTVPRRRVAVKKSAGTPKKYSPASSYEYKKEVSLGYNTTQGNTDTSQVSVSALFNKKKKYVDEWTFKGSFSYSESDNKMNARKWYGMGRYAFNWSSNKAYYTFYRLEMEHDKFAAVHFRMTPASGVGYWIYDFPETKLLVEAVLGVEYTDYYSKGDSTELVVVPRLFFEQQVSPTATFTQDLYLYPALTDWGNCRIRSESSFTVSINKNLGIRLSLVDEYNSDPPSNVDENDLTFTSSLVYSFGS